MAKVRRSSGKKERHSASRQATARVASLFYRQHFAMSPRYPVMAGRFHFALPFFMGGIHASPHPFHLGPAQVRVHVAVCLSAPPLRERPVLARSAAQSARRAHRLIQATPPASQHNDVTDRRRHPRQGQHREPHLSFGMESRPVRVAGRVRVGACANRWQRRKRNVRAKHRTSPSAGTGLCNGLAGSCHGPAVQRCRAAKRRRHWQQWVGWYGWRRR